MIQRRTRLARTPLKRKLDSDRQLIRVRGEIRRMSKRAAAVQRGARAALNRELEVTPRACALGPRLAAVGLSGCQGRATCWHELRKRSSAGSTTNRANLEPACSWCNNELENHPDLARAAGLVTREGDDGWAATSVRNDR